MSDNHTRCEQCNGVIYLPDESSWTPKIMKYEGETEVFLVCRPCATSEQRSA